VAQVSLLATIADQSASQVAGATAPTMPTGSIITYAGSSAPTGWLVCDGASLSTTTYAALFSTIGYSFGGSGGSFNLPDLRGRFVRYDDNMGTHGITGVSAAGAASRDSGRVHGSSQTQTTAKNGLTNATSSLTISLNNQSANHSHTDSGHSHSTTIPRAGTSAPVAGVTNFTTSNTNYDPWQVINSSSNSASLGTQNASHTHTLSSGSSSAQVLTGDAETRPINIALNAIIKI